MPFPYKIPQKLKIAANLGDNYDFVVPAIPGDDFISYGRSVMLENAGILDTQSVYNLLFLTEALYLNYLRSDLDADLGVSRPGYSPVEVNAAVMDEGWNNVAAHKSWSESFKKDAVYFSSCAKAAAKLSDIVWRPNLTSEGEVLGVYPDKRHIVERNLERIYAPNDPNKIYTSSLRPLPLLALNGPVATDVKAYKDFNDRCDKEIKSWIEKIFSLLMLNYGEASMAVKESAEAAYIAGFYRIGIEQQEFSADAPLYPFGDIAFIKNNRRITGLFQKLRTIPESAVRPNKAVWAAAAFQRAALGAANAQIASGLKEEIEKEKNPAAVVQELRLPGEDDQPHTDKHLSETEEAETEPEEEQTTDKNIDESKFSILDQAFAEPAEPEEPESMSKKPEPVAVTEKTKPTKAAKDINSILDGAFDDDSEDYSKVKNKYNAFLSSAKLKI